MDKDVLSAISSALAGTGYTIDFVDVHWYPYGSGTDAQEDADQLAFQYTPSLGCCGDAGVASVVTQIRSDITNYYTLSNASDLQILVTETGVTSDNGNPGIMPGLFAADDNLTWFENGGVNVEYQELNNGFLTDAGPGIPQGPWYATKFDSTIARPGDSLVTSSSTNALLRVHAAKRTDGQTGVILINDDPSNSTTATLDITGATLASSGTEYSFGTANFSSGAVTANSGIASKTVSGLGNTFKVTVPAYSMLGLLIPAGSSCTPTTIVPYISVNGGSTWTEESTTTVTSTTTAVDLGPQPVSGGSWSWTGPKGFTSTSRQINSIPLSTGGNTYVATYTNTSSCKSTQTFTITVN